MGAYKGKASVFKEADEKTGGFKKGGKVKKSVGSVDGVMSSAHAGRKPRKSGGGVFSSAAGGGTPRGKASHY
jgi:hypothetical protein